MQELKTFNTQDLILTVSKNYDPSKLNLSEWERFLDVLCNDREYQKQAIRDTVVYLFSGKYTSIENLVKENYSKNVQLQDRYGEITDYYRRIQIPNRLSATIDLATGTGKSYVMYGVAQIALGLGIVDKVLVLCPSLTIERGLTEKFIQLSSDSHLKAAVPALAKSINPSIIDATKTINVGDICIENIHSIYSKNSSSIQDSLGFGKGVKCLILNDEVHHAYNKITGNDTTSKDIKKWTEFILDPSYGFRYIMGFTGTAYYNNEYFNDVIYRYSLRQAIEDRIVKTISYVFKDEQTQEQDEKFQKIYQNHQSNKLRYSQIKPLTLLVTQTIIQAERLKEDLCEFLAEKENIPVDDVRSNKVLIVTSKHTENVNLYLPQVDSVRNSFEWIVSVSMLTEGWDVKNVFQIVPMEERAFNSKLLIAQVLGRGLRLPLLYPQAQVIVFNHDSWTNNIRHLVDEILELELKLVSHPLLQGEREKYHFEVFTVKYEKTFVEVPVEKKNVFDYSRETITLQSQIDNYKPTTTFVNTRFEERQVEYLIEKELFSVDSIINKIYEEFKVREWEGITLKLKDGDYTKNNLPPKETIERIIRNSMKARLIEGDFLDRYNRQSVLSAFNTLLRQKSKSVLPKRIVTSAVRIQTINCSQETISVSGLRRGTSVFYTPDFETELTDIDVKNVFLEAVEDGTLPRDAMKEVNTALFKTPIDLVFSTAEPERKFIELLCKVNYINSVEAWFKSKNQGFYEIDYTITSDAGRHTKQGKFNPDFFLLIKVEEGEVIVVVEIKSNGDDSEENKAKFRAAKAHFQSVNDTLAAEGVAQRYIFHFLSPADYPEFFGYLVDGRLIGGSDTFRGSLENLLSE